MARMTLVLAVLAGCAALQKGGALTVSSASPGPSVSSDDPAPARHDIVTRDETRQLIGLTLDDAKKQLAALGYHGEIQIDASTDVTDTKCQYDRVCAVFPEDFGLDAPIAIRVGKAKLDIAPP